MSNDEERESRQLKLSDKTSKKIKQKFDKKWVGVVLLVSILLSLGFYLIAGRGMEEMAARFRSRSSGQVERKTEAQIPALREKSDEKSLWDRASEMFGPAVYEF